MNFPKKYADRTLKGMYTKLALPNETVELLHRYFDAFNNFYELIPLKDAYGIIGSNENDITKEQFITFSEIVRHEAHWYYILGLDELYSDVPKVQPFDRYIVHESLVDIDYEEFYSLYEGQQGKPLYVPPKEELLKYTDDLYFEHTPQTSSLYNFFLGKMRLTFGEAEELVGECDGIIRTSIYGDPIDDILGDLEHMGITFTKEQYEIFIPLLVDMTNHTRLPVNRGFTPSELAVKMGRIKGGHLREKSP